MVFKFLSLCGELSGLDAARPCSARSQKRLEPPYTIKKDKQPAALRQVLKQGLRRQLSEVV